MFTFYCVADTFITSIGSTPILKEPSQAASRPAPPQGELLAHCLRRVDCQDLALRKTPPAGGGGTTVPEGDKVASRSDDGEGQDAE